MVVNPDPFSDYFWVFRLSLLILGYVQLFCSFLGNLWQCSAISGLSIPELFLDYPRLSWDYRDIIPSSSDDCLPILPRLSLDYPGFIPGLSLGLVQDIPRSFLASSGYLRLFLSIAKAGESKLWLF